MFVFSTLTPPLFSRTYVTSPLIHSQSKQSPVEDLLNQADQLISTQRPRAEVYAAMAESLGLAWKELNQQLETRKMLLDLAVAFQT